MGCLVRNREGKYVIVQLLDSVFQKLCMLKKSSLPKKSDILIGLFELFPPEQSGPIAQIGNIAQMDNAIPKCNLTFETIP